METQNELNKKILNTTLKIQKEFPALSAHLSEMPEYYPTTDHSGVNNADLKDYLESLNVILNRFSKEH